MNDFDNKTARKIGEVLAFTLLGIETFKKSQKPLAKILGKNLIIKILFELSCQQKEILVYLKKSNMSETALYKARNTERKLKEMQELYLKNQWTDGTEIIEWLGFFEGAAAVHWALVNNLVTERKFKKMARNCREFHYKLVKICMTEIR